MEAINENKSLKATIVEYLQLIDHKRYIHISGICKSETECNRLVDVIESKMLSDKNAEIENILDEIELSCYEE